MSNLPDVDQKRSDAEWRGNTLLLYALLLWKHKNADPMNTYHHLLVSGNTHLSSLALLLTNSSFYVDEFKIAHGKYPNAKIVNVKVVNFYVDDFERLRAVIKNGGVIETGWLSWRCEEDNSEDMIWLSVNALGLADAPACGLPRKQVLTDFEDIRQQYQETKGQGISIHKGLVPYLVTNWQAPQLGDQWLRQKSMAERIGLEVLALSQEIADSGVQQCWPMLISYGIRSGEINSQVLDEWIDFLQDCIDNGCGGGFGFNDFYVELINEQIEVSYYNSPSCYCTPQAFVDELKTLLRHYHESLDVTL